MKSLFFLAMIFLSNSVFSFSMRTCSRTFKSYGGSENSQMIMGLFHTTSSSAQFTTSTGNCAAIGMNKEERAQSFYAFNHEKILEDVAKGGGEYYASLSRLWDCDNKLTPTDEIRRNYHSLSKLELEDQYMSLKGSSGCKAAGVEFAN